MKFTNKTLEARSTPWGIVDSGADVDVPPGEVDGLVLQCGPDGAWAPGDDEAKAAVEAASPEPVKAAPRKATSKKTT